MRIDQAQLKKTAGNIARWAQKKEWIDDFASLLDDHAGEAFAPYDIGLDELRETDRTYGSMLSNAVMDDMCSQIFPIGEDDDDQGRNLVEDYLRHGYREPPAAERYLKALRDSFCTVVEVVAVEPGQWVEVRDLIARGATVRVREHSGSLGLKPGRFVATKLIEFEGDILFSGSLLPLVADQSDYVIQSYEEGKASVEEELAKLDTANRPEPDAASQIAELAARQVVAPAATHAWLTGILIHLFGGPPDETEDEVAAAILEAGESRPADPDAYYRQMLDEPSVVLGGKTPREMSQSRKKSHREDAMLYLISIEMAEAMSRKAEGLPPYDGAWLWKELGLKDPRKK